MELKINKRVVAAAQLAYDKGGMIAALEAALEQARKSGWRGAEFSRADIEIAIPEFMGKPGGRPKYPFWKMKVGEVYELEGVHISSVSAAASAYGKNHNMKFALERRGTDPCKILVKRIS